MYFKEQLERQKIQRLQVLRQKRMKKVLPYPYWMPSPSRAPNESLKPFL